MSNRYSSEMVLADDAGVKHTFTQEEADRFGVSLEQYAYGCLDGYNERIEWERAYVSDIMMGL